MGTSIRWGDVFGDLTIASAIIDRIVHHADVISPKATATGSKNTNLPPYGTVEPQPRGPVFDWH